MVSTRELRGKRIESISYTASPNGAYGTAHTNVVIHLSDGSRLLFMTEELEEGGDYGLLVWRVGAASLERR